MVRKRKSKSRKRKTASTRPVESAGIDRNRSLRLLVPALIVLLTLLAYIPAMQGGYIWDDDNYVTENTDLRSFQGLANIWLEPKSSPQYYPLVFTSFWFEYHMWGPDPTGYHVVNVLLHAINAILLWMILRRLQVPGAWLAALVFAVHPVFVESVAWVTERKNVLSGLFYFSSALCLMQYFGVDAVIKKPSNRNKWYVASLLLFVCALLSKTVTASLPVAMAIVLWWKNEKIGWHEATALIPFFLVGLLFGLATVWLEKHHVGALGSEWDQSLVERFLIAGRALWFYAGKLLWPVNLVFNYPRWQISSAALWQYVFPLGVILLLAGGWAFRHRLGRAPLACMLFFCATLFPALGFFNVFPFRYSYVADHFQYLAGVGILVLFIGGAAQLAARLSLRLQKAAGALGVAILIVLFVLTWHQGHLYKDLRTLWTTTLKQNPSSALAHYNLGLMMAKEGNLEEGTRHLYEALRLVPDSPDIHNIVGVALVKLERFGEAESHFSEAVRLRPEFTEARYYLALLLVRNKRIDEAIEHLSIAVQLQPDYAAAHFELGRLLGSQGLIEKAAYHFSETVRIQPENESARKHLQLSVQLMQKESSARVAE